MGQPHSTQRIIDSLEGAVGKCLHNFQTRKTLHVCKIGDTCYSNFEWAAEFGIGDDDYVEGSLQYILDSGATVHCFNDLTMFHSIDPNAHLPNLRVANGGFSKVVAVGTVRIRNRCEKLHMASFLPAHRLRHLLEHPPCP